MISGWGRSPGGGNGSPLQPSCLESPINPGAWQPTVHRVAQRQTGLNAQKPIFCLDDSYATVYFGQNFLNCVLKECELIVCNYLSKIRFYFSDVKIHFFVLLLPFNLKNYVTLKGIYFNRITANTKYQNFQMTKAFFCQPVYYTFYTNLISTPWTLYCEFCF